MRILLERTSKKYKHDTIFHELSLQLSQGDRLGISGPNGSGKSTLLKVISGQTSPTKGIRNYLTDTGQGIEEEQVYSRINYAAPYIELIEEFTLPEILKFYSGFRKSYLGTIEDLTDLSGIAFRNRYIKDYSSGMKQRVKLLLALGFESEIVLLDEPSTNLDKEGVLWTQELIKNYLKGRTLVIASNEPNDFAVIGNILDIRDYKK